MGGAGIAGAALKTEAVVGGARGGEGGGGGWVEGVGVDGGIG